MLGLFALPSAAQIKLSTKSLNTGTYQTATSKVATFEYFLGDPFACHTEDEVVRDPEDDRYHRPVIGMMHVTGVNGSRLSLPCSVWEDYTNYNLAAQPQFPPIDGLDDFVYTLTVPQGVSIRRIEAPSGWVLDWRQYQNRLLLWGAAPATADTAVFEAIDANGQSHPLHQPVKPSLNACTSASLAFFMRLGDNLDARICSAGNTSGLSWHYVPNDPANRLPSGFSLSLPRPTFLEALPSVHKASTVRTVAAPGGSLEPLALGRGLRPACCSFEMRKIKWLQVGF